MEREQIYGCSAVKYIKKVLMAKILVIEDDQSIKKAIFYILDSRGFEVHSAANGDEGIELAKNVFLI